MRKISKLSLSKNKRKDSAAQSSVKVKKPFKTNVKDTVLAWDLQSLTKYVMFTGVVIAAIGGYLAYSNLYMTHEHRFWTAVGNSMSTSGVTRTLETGGTGNLAVQNTRFNYTPESFAHSRVSYSQKNATTDTNVQTEGLSFLDAQYSRYIAFSTNQQSEDGTIPTLEGLIGRWEGNQYSEEELDNARLNYLSDMVSLMIFGNFPAEFRNDVISQMKENNVYKINFNDVADDTRDDRPVLIYQARVNLKQYVGLLNQAFIRAGYGEFPPLDPANYQEGNEVNAVITLDKRSNSIKEISFGNRKEVYSNYGVVSSIERPNAEFGQGELETKVQEELNGAF